MILQILLKNYNENSGWWSEGGGLRRLQIFHSKIENI